jgi:hypothetical protein
MTEAQVREIVAKALPESGPLTRAEIEAKRAERVAWGESASIKDIAGDVGYSKRHVQRVRAKR